MTSTNPSRSHSLLVTVDVGNTSTSFGTYRLTGSKPGRPKIRTLSTAHLRKPVGTRKFLRKNFHFFSHQNAPSVAGVIVSSVVPAADRTLERVLEQWFHRPATFVTSRTSSLIKIRYKKPSEVGADRIVNARAAIAHHRGASIVVDFGTATTFDCVTAKGEYLGGVIAPGPVISAEALYQRTAKLPLVVLERPALILGRNTLESIQSGLYYGYRGLVKEIVGQLKLKLGREAKVYATGGQSQWILKGLKIIDYYVPDLTLQGLYYLWQDAHAPKV